MADPSKNKRNQMIAQQMQPQQQQQLQPAQPANAERYNLLSSSIDERTPVPSLIPKPLSVVFFYNSFFVYYFFFFFS